MRLFGFLLLLLVGGFSSVFAEGKGLVLSYDAGGNDVRFSKDSAGVVQVDGLPYPGIVLYKPDTQVVYYQHPALPDWIVLSASAMASAVVSASALPGAPWQPYMEAPTRRWEVKAGSAKCGNWFASPKAGVVAGLTVGDILRVVNAVKWLNEGNFAAPCERITVHGDVEKAVGLPLFMDTAAGPWHLTAFSAADVAPIALPDALVPVSDAVRFQLLLSQLAQKERADFMAKYASVPLSAQLNALEALLKTSFRD